MNTQLNNSTDISNHDKDSSRTGNNKSKTDSKSSAADAHDADIIFFTLRSLPEDFLERAPLSLSAAVEAGGSKSDFETTENASPASEETQAESAAQSAAGDEHEVRFETVTICASADPDYVDDATHATAATTKGRRSSRPQLSRRQSSSDTDKPTPPSTNVSPRRRLKFTAKRLGEIAEAEFLAKAADLGFTVLKPWGDSEPYDFVVDARRHGRFGLSRIQLKSAHRKGRGDRGYSFSAHDFSLHAYTRRDIEALIAVVVPEDAWYIIPIDDAKHIRGLHLFPSSKRRRSKYEKYRNAWYHLEAHPPNDNAPEEE